ncbi:MAG: hypothetical protein EOO04_09990 [Chitinophagaceae bacterium]|nr:MAG: hypothetical protein EOO04_09990 [Chitinophagaceae bacterium]
MKKIFSVIFAGLLSIPMLAQVPLLNSYSDSSATIYIDFDGEYVDGSAWNFYGPIDAQPSGLSPDAIREVFARVAEDYKIFNVNITTDSALYAAAPLKQRMRIIVTSTNNWYPGAGGTSYTRSFTWGDGTPAWVFSNALGYNAKNISEAVSHEAGHTLGLYHQSEYSAACAKTAEYSPGKGTGEIGWAPIMGIGYGRNMTTWHTGFNARGCTILQEDINVIASPLNGFGLRQDDHGDSHDAASEINLSTLDFQAAGMINNYDDRDVFKFTLTSPTNLRINAVPQNVGAGNSGANVDIKVGLLSSFSDTIGKYNPTELLNAGVDTNLNAGTYFIVVDGVSNENLSDYGSVGTYALAGFIANVLPIHHLNLTGKIAADLHVLNWSYRADEAVKKINVEVSRDGKRFSTLAELPADARTFSWKPLDNSTAFYRVKIITVVDERAYYSNNETLKTSQGKKIDILSTIVSGSLNIVSKGNYNYQLIDETGRLIQKGILKNGSNAIDVKSASKGLLLLRLQEGNETTVYKFIRE